MATETGPVRVDRPEPRVARLTLARPERRNAQNAELLYALNDAFDAAARDPGVKVVVLAADGPDFSAGHDLADPGGPPAERAIGPYAGWDAEGAAGRDALESEMYLGLCLRWRSIPKPTIAAVQGRCIAGGLMLAWPCDLIVAADDALFSDPVAAFGVPGHEFFVHPFEVGHRRAKEMLFTGEPVTAQDARMLGMVNRVVPRDALEAETLALAAKIAARPAYGLALAKRAVDGAMDGMGLRRTAEAVFDAHQLAHTHNRVVHGDIIDPAGMAVIRDESRR